MYLMLKGRKEKPTNLTKPLFRGEENILGDIYYKFEGGLLVNNVMLWVLKELGRIQFNTTPQQNFQVEWSLEHGQIFIVYIPQGNGFRVCDKKKYYKQLAFSMHKSHKFHGPNVVNTHKKYSYLSICLKKSLPITIDTWQNFSQIFIVIFLSCTYRYI